MTIDNVVSEDTGIQLLAGLLAWEDVEEAVLNQLKREGDVYKNSWLHPNAPPALRQVLSARFIKTIYNIARVFKDDLWLYDYFTDRLFACGEEIPEDLKPTEIFESVLTYSLASKSRRWRDYASKTARILELLSQEGLSANDVVRRLESVGGIEKLI